MSDRSFFCGPNDCEDALQSIMEVIEARMKKEDRAAVHIVVLDPVIKPWEIYSQTESGILWEKTVGEAPDGSQIVEFAAQKACLALYHQMTLSDVWQKTPAILATGDIGWWGGVFEHGIAVGVSGFSERVDQEIGILMARRLAALVERSASFNGADRVSRLRFLDGFLAPRLD